MPESKSVQVFTDGACSGNPGAGGCAAMLVYGSHRKEFVRGYRWTTNNRMEIMAVIMGLEALRYPCVATIHSDSKYLVRACTAGWLKRWKSNGWRTIKRTEVKNVDLWQRLDELLSIHELHFQWVKGHNGHPENARCDKLAVKAAKRKRLEIDSGFEKVRSCPKNGKSRR